MAGLFFLITVAKRIVKIRLYTVFENLVILPPRDNHYLEFSFLFHFVFYRNGSYYKSCLAESPKQTSSLGILSWSEIHNLMLHYAGSQPAFNKNQVPEIPVHIRAGEALIYFIICNLFF